MTNAPIAVVDQRFCMPHPISLVMKEKVFSFTGDDFQIKDANSGQTFFMINGKFISLRQRKVLSDYQGVPIAHFKHKIISLLPSFMIYQGEDSSNLIAKIDKKFTFLKSKMLASVTNRVTGQPMLITMKGNWRDKKAEIYLGEEKEGGQLIASVQRKSNGKHYFLGQQDYVVTIQPGVDAAFMVLMVLAFDEANNEQY